jgi:hypothetical protein
MFHKTKFSPRQARGSLEADDQASSSSEPQVGQTAVSESVSSQSAHWFPSVPRKTFSLPQLPQRMMTSPSSISPQNWHEYDIIGVLIIL